MPSLFDFGQNKGSIYPFWSLQYCPEQVLFRSDKGVWILTNFWGLALTSALMVTALPDTGRRGSMKLSTHKLPWMVQILLYGTLVLTLINSGGLFILLVQQTQLSARLSLLEGRLHEISESSMVEFLTQVRGPEDQGEPSQSSRNKRSQELHHAQELHQAHEELLHAKQEVHHGQGIHRAEQQGDMMMMMTYSMVPVRQTPCFLNFINSLCPIFCW